LTPGVVPVEIDVDAKETIMATGKAAHTTAKTTAAKLKLNKATLKDLAIGSRRARDVKGGRLPETMGCPKLPPK
jgi:hypothetical protein